MANRRRCKKHQRKEGILGTNKRCISLSQLLRVDEIKCQGLSTIGGVDNTMAHGLSPSERVDKTGAVASSSSTTSDIHLIVDFAENKIVKNKYRACISLSLRVDKTVHNVSPCDRRFDETGADASLSFSASDLKLIVGCGKFIFLYLVVGCCVLFCLLCAISYVVCSPPAFLDQFICFKFGAA